MASDWLVDTLGQYELTNVSKTLNYASKTLGIWSTAIRSLIYGSDLGSAWSRTKNFNLCRTVFYKIIYSYNMHLPTYLYDMYIISHRYRAIIYPLRPKLSRWVILGAIIAIWIMSSLLALPTILYSETFSNTYVLMQ